MRGKCIICKAKCADANDGNIWEDIWIKVSGKFKWVCRDCVSVINSKRIQGNNVTMDEVVESVDEEFPEVSEENLRKIELK